MRFRIRAKYSIIPCAQQKYKSKLCRVVIFPAEDKFNTKARRLAIKLQVNSFLEVWCFSEANWGLSILLNYLFKGSYNFKHTFVYVTEKGEEVNFLTYLENFRNDIEKTRFVRFILGATEVLFQTYR